MLLLLISQCLVWPSLFVAKVKHPGSSPFAVCLTVGVSFPFSDWSSLSLALIDVPACILPYLLVGCVTFGMVSFGTIGLLLYLLLWYLAWPSLFVAKATNPGSNFDPVVVFRGRSDMFYYHQRCFNILWREEWKKVSSIAPEVRVALSFLSLVSAPLPFQIDSCFIQNTLWCKNQFTKTLLGQMNCHPGMVLSTTQAYKIMCNKNYLLLYLAWPSLFVAKATNPGSNSNPVVVFRGRSAIFVVPPALFQYPVKGGVEES
jgi:hypothetical protein